MLKPEVGGKCGCISTRRDGPIILVTSVLRNVTNCSLKLTITMLENNELISDLNGHGSTEAAADGKGTRASMCALFRNHFFYINYDIQWDCEREKKQVNASVISLSEIANWYMKITIGQNGIPNANISVLETNWKQQMYIKNSPRNRTCRLCAWPRSSLRHCSEPLYKNNEILRTRPIGISVFKAWEDNVYSS